MPLLDAARASIRCGLDHYVRFGGSDDEALRQAAIDLHGGIELLLKEQIRRVNVLLLHERVDAAVVLEQHLRAQRGAEITPDRSVKFSTAMTRAAQLSSHPEIYLRQLDGLNTLRNDLVHLGDTQIPMASQIAIVRDAIRFVDSYAEIELDQRTPDFLGSDRWIPVETILLAEDKEGEQRLQGILQQHRDRYRSYNPAEMARLRRTLPDVGEPNIDFDCPACGETAIAGLHESVDVDEEGISGVALSVDKIACPVCGLLLAEPTDLERFQHLAEKYVQREADYLDAWDTYVDEVR